MNWLTLDEIIRESKKSSLAALDCTIKHWRQLATAGESELAAAAEADLTGTAPKWSALCHGHCTNCPVSRKLCSNDGTHRSAQRAFGNWRVTTKLVDYAKFVASAAAVIDELERVRESLTKKETDEQYKVKWLSRSEVENAAKASELAATKSSMAHWTQLAYSGMAELAAAIDAGLVSYHSGFCALCKRYYPTCDECIIKREYRECCSVSTAFGWKEASLAFIQFNRTRSELSYIEFAMVASKVANNLQKLVAVAEREEADRIKLEEEQRLEAEKLAAEKKPFNWLTLADIQAAAKLSESAAVRMSIEHWTQLATASEEELDHGWNAVLVDTNSRFCALCIRHSPCNGSSAVCNSCPVVKKHGKSCGSSDTFGWREANVCFWKYRNGRSKDAHADFVRAANNMVNSLKSLLVDVEEQERLASLPWVTDTEAEKAAAMSDHDALACSIEHWRQLSQRTVEELKFGRAAGKFSLGSDCCALCIRHRGEDHACTNCPVRAKWDWNCAGEQFGYVAASKAYHAWLADATDDNMRLFIEKAKVVYANLLSLYEQPTKWLTQAEIKAAAAESAQAAMDCSIEHWHQLFTATDAELAEVAKKYQGNSEIVGVGHRWCALCLRYNTGVGVMCSGCPVGAKYGSGCDSDANPFGPARGAFLRMMRSPSPAFCSEFRISARAMYDSLVSLSESKSC